MMKDEAMDQAAWEAAVHEAVLADDPHRPRWVRNASMAIAVGEFDKADEDAVFAGWLTVRGLLESQEPMADALRLGWSMVEQVRNLLALAAAEGRRRDAVGITEQGWLIGREPTLGERVALRFYREAWLDLLDVDTHAWRQWWRHPRRHWRHEVCGTRSRWLQVLRRNT